MTLDMGRYRQRQRQREEDSQSELQAAALQLQDLQVETRQLAARQKLMLQLVDKQETRICLLVNSEVCLDASCIPSNGKSSHSINIGNVSGSPIHLAQCISIRARSRTDERIQPELHAPMIEVMIEDARLCINHKREQQYSGPLTCRMAGYSSQTACRYACAGVYEAGG